MEPTKTIFGPELVAYQGFHGSKSVCGLMIVQNSTGHYVVFCVEVQGNPGTSITNCAIVLATGILSKFRIPWNNFTWIEHYAGRTDWSLVTFQANKETGESGKPSWRPMTEDDWTELCVTDVREILKNVDWGRGVNPW
jgi:hypothetical protein